jgi:translocation and assembly module TamB
MRDETGKAARSKRMNKPAAKVFLVLALVLSFFVVLVVATGFFLQTDHASRLIQARVNAAIPGELSWRNLRFSLLDGRFEAADVVVKNPANRELVRIDRLFLRLAAKKLLQKEIAITNLTVDTWTATIRLDNTGRLTLLDAFFAKKTADPKRDDRTFRPLPFNLSVDELRLAGGVVNYKKEGDTDGKIVHNVTAKTINLLAHGNLSRKQAQVDLTIGRTDIDLPAVQTQLESLHVKAAYENGRIHIPVFEFDPKGQTVTLTGTVEDLAGQPVFDLKADMTASLAEIGPMLKLDLPLSGKVKLDLRASGHMENPEVALALAYGGGRLFDRPIEGLDLAVYLKDKILTIDHMRSDMAAGTLVVDGAIDFRAAFAKGFLSSKRDLEAITYDLGLQSNGIDLAKLPGAKADIRGNLSAAIKVAGTGISPNTLAARADITLLARKFTVTRATAPVDFKVIAAGELNKGAVSIRRLNLSGEQFEWTSRAGFNFKTKAISADGALNAHNLANTLRPLGIEDARGRLSLELHAGGKLKTPTFDCKLTGEGLRVRGYAADTLRLDAVLDPNGMLKLSQLELRAKDSAISGHGTMQVFDHTYARTSDRTSDLYLSAKNVSVKDFMADTGLDGLLNGDLHLKENHHQLDGTLSLQGRDLKFNAYHTDHLDLQAQIMGSVLDPGAVLKLEGNGLDLGFQKFSRMLLRGVLDKNKMVIRALDVDLIPEETLSAQGSIVFPDRYTLQLQGEKILLDHIFFISKNGAIKGNGAIILSGQGSFSDPYLDAQIHVSDVTYQAKRLSDFRVHAELKEGRVAVDAKGDFDLTGDYDVADQNFSAALVLKATDLAPYFELSNRPELAGQVTGRIAAAGNLAAPDQIEATAQLTDLALDFKGMEMVRSQEVTLLLRRKILSTPGFSLALFRKGHLAVSGQGRIDGPVAYLLKGAVPLEVIDLFTDALPDVFGQIRLSVCIEGRLASPVISGRFDLEKIGFTVPGLWQAVKEMNGHIRATAEEVTIEDVSGRLDTGRFALKGNIGLDGFRPAKGQLFLHCDELPINIADTLDVTINSKLALAVLNQKGRLTGDISIVDGTYYKDVDLNLMAAIKSVGRKKRETAPLTAKSGAAALPDIDLDIKVDSRSAFAVDNNLARLDIVPYLKIAGTLSHPLLSGRTEVESGIVVFQKQAFEIDKCIIDFINPYKIEPTIDLQSQTVIGHRTIMLKISGTPDKLAFELSSDPPESDQDILSLILTGKTTRELAQGGGKGSLAAGNLAADALESIFGKDIKQTTGMDIFEVDYQNTATADDPATISVTMGKELTKRLTVKVEVKSKAGETVQRGIAEYKFLENFLVNGFQESDGVYGGEVVFRHEFR